MPGRGLIAASLVGLITLASFAAAQVPVGCRPGQTVADLHDKIGVIVTGHGDACLIKSKDGHTQRWIGLQEIRPIETPSKAAPPTSVPDPPGSAAEAVTAGVRIAKPLTVNRRVYRADARGHFTLTAKVNGVPVRLLVDTGATLVSLTVRDAGAVGLKTDRSTFTGTVHTANGTANAALVTIREVRIEQLQIDDVPAAVVENLSQSVLGMSFLRRLKGFQMRDGELTITW
jgi:aspartyl protease family protein